MNCELIFYLATKTNLCEKALVDSLSELNLRFYKSSFATTPTKLGELVIDAFERSNIAFIVGGLTSFDSSGIENVLSRALADKRPDDLKKLRNPLSSADGYLVRQGGQLMVVLPDEPDEISAITGAELRHYLERFTDL